ncbi:hypothetical protein ACIRS3_22645 [Streptomyces virginiae]|uniref:hypothetical protein n=1 Tax=Streptomyces virginiae TaxID=1961 RepID=UPI00382F560C
MPDDVFATPLPELPPEPQTPALGSRPAHPADRVRDCLDYPLLYEMAELLPPPNAVGCPREYPAIVYLIMAALTPVTKSKRSTVGLLSSPQDWRSVRAGVRRHLGRRAAAALPLTAPSRGQYQDALNNLPVPCVDLLEEEFRRYASRQALRQGLFPGDIARVWSRPERRQLIVGDATVPKTPSKARRETTADPVTGRSATTVSTPPPAPTTRTGRRRRKVRGTKWFFASGRDDGYWSRVILSFSHVAGGEYEDEAAVAVRQFTALKSALPHCMGIVYDGAIPRGPP